MRKNINKRANWWRAFFVTVGEWSIRCVKNDRIFAYVRFFFVPLRANLCKYAQMLTINC